MQWLINGVDNYYFMIKYINGYPAKSHLTQIINEFFVDDNYKPRISGTYKYSGSLVWERGIINDRVELFVDFLKKKNIEVESYRKYISPTTGTIVLKNKQKKNGQNR
jgi:hypothetical protein